MPAPPALRTLGLSKSYGPVRAAQDVGVQVQFGQTLALLGPSGCGKSTVLRCVAGLERPERGQIEIAGRDVSALPPEQRQVGLVFQDYALFPHLDVLGNVSYGPRQRRVPRAEAEAQARAALVRVGLEHLERRKPDELSGGQQQRVALARALATGAPLLLLDEPLSNLDEKLRMELRRDLRQLFLHLSVGVLLVTHDQREALALADTVAVMRAGEVKQHGAAQEVFARPATAWIAAFLGWANLLPLGSRQVRLVPEQALSLEGEETWPIIASQVTEQGETVTVAHALGPLTLHLSARERERVRGGRLALQVDTSRLMDVPDDREEG